MHVLVATVAHHPEDARILHRQIRALLDAGHSVTYIAPFREHRVVPWLELRAVDVPRAGRRTWLKSLRAAREAIAQHASSADIVLFHDPELLLSLPRRRPAAVWDVHEDTAALLATSRANPTLRRTLAALVRRFERYAERRVHLLLAEESYRDRFHEPHPVTPNTTTVPERPARSPRPDRVVHLGRISSSRGAEELVALGRLLRSHGITMDAIGPADRPSRSLLREAQREEALRWYGFIPNDQALRMISGALAGVSLLRDTPRNRRCFPTTVVEYMAHGVPVVTSPAPAAAALTTEQPQGQCGIVVPYNDVEAAADAVLRLQADTWLRDRFALVGHGIARARFHWPTQAEVFVRQIEEWAGAGPLHRGIRSSTPPRMPPEQPTAPRPSALSGAATTAMPGLPGR
ncbi:glycosyltransferase family 4 protein [Salinactinospora qingdaonensis]|uniref:Glycosyltransferase family 4 protein n=1 Tax=Salinactinospora qingdaonensis TaxID=702744 RepID=A0ABP7FZC8_9ACTN